MPDILLQAEPRTILGKKVARLRRSGITPGNIYGHNVPSQAIQLPTTDLVRTLRVARGTHLVRLSLEGEAAPRTVLIHHLTRKPTTDEILHIEFYEVSMTEKASVNIPLMLVGSSTEAEAANAAVVQHMATLAVDCLPGDIPDRIEVDISSLTLAHPMIRVADLHLPENVTTTLDPEEVVVSVSQSAAEESAAASGATEPQAETAPASTA